MKIVRWLGRVLVVCLKLVVYLVPVLFITSRVVWKAHMEERMTVWDMLRLWSTTFRNLFWLLIL